MTDPILDTGDDTARITENAGATVDKTPDVIADMSAAARQAAIILGTSLGLGTSAAAAATQAAADRQLRELNMIDGLRIADDTGDHDVPPGFETLLALNLGPDDGADVRLTVTYHDPGRSMSYSHGFITSRKTLAWAKSEPVAARYLDTVARERLNAPPSASLKWTLTPGLALMDVLNRPEPPQAAAASPDRSVAIAYARARATGDLAEMGRLLRKIAGDEAAPIMAEALRDAADALRGVADSAAKIVEAMTAATHHDACREMCDDTTGGHQ